MSSRQPIEGVFFLKHLFHKKYSQLQVLEKIYYKIPGILDLENVICIITKNLVNVANVNGFTIFLCTCTRFGYFDFRRNFLNLSRNGAILPKILCRIQIWVSKIEIQIGQNFKHLKKDKKFEKILYTELLQIIQYTYSTILLQ